MSKYDPIRLFGINVQWGYERDPTNKNMLLPIDEQLDALAEAKKYLKTCSIRDVAAWLTERTGRPISHTALHRRIQTDERRRRRDAGKKAWRTRFVKEHTATEAKENSAEG